MDKKKTTLDAFKGVTYYKQFLASYEDLASNTSISSVFLSQAIYYHMYHAHYAQWRLRIKTNRFIAHSLSNYFQDLIAFYLKCSLSNRYSVYSEYSKPIEIEKDGKLKKKTIRPDILIEKEGKLHFAIEVKTNLGWARKSPNEMKTRINEIYRAFSIDKKNVIYILETPRNVNKKFEQNFWKNGEPQQPKKFPFNKIFPLYYTGPDSSYWKENKNQRNESIVHELEQTAILKKADRDMITPFSKILKMIDGSKECSTFT